MTGCPLPHDAPADPDGYCPVCGLSVRPAGADRCDGCGAPRTGGAFCEHCGQPREGAQESVPTLRPLRWVALVAADRRQYDALGGDTRGFVFPPLPERRVELDTDLVRIGQFGPASGGPPPEIDLCGPPPDPGVSRQHAELVRQADGGWAVRDTGSTNGTFVGRHRLTAGALMPLTAGDRVRLGLWSRITLAPER